MKITIWPIITFLGLQLFLVLLAGLMYFWINYENEVVTSGESLGFLIGESKEEVYGKVFSNLAALDEKRQEIFISIEADNAIGPKVGVNEGFHILVQTYMHPSGREFFFERDVWKFYLNASRLNIVQLTFCNDRLCEIHRRRRVFELP